MNWNRGDRVRHVNQVSWGRGEVLSIAGVGKLLVYFENAGEKLLMDGMLTRIEGEDAAAPIVIPSKPKGAARKNQVGTKPALTLQQYRMVFLQQYPGGFSDPEYLRRERQYKVDASAMLRASLSTQEFDALLQARDFAEICRRAKADLSATNLVNRFELIKLNNGLKEPAGRRAFAEALHGLLEGEGEFEHRFTRFCDALGGLGAGKWPIATYFAYMKWPERHILLKPIPTQRIADACGVSLNYQTQPNWLTYRSLLDLAQRLSTELAEFKPTDMIDLQSFIWLTARTGQ